MNEYVYTIILTNNETQSIMDMNKYVYMATLTVYETQNLGLQPKMGQQRN